MKYLLYVSALIGIFVLIAGTATLATAEEVSLRQLDVFYKLNERAPSNFAPSDGLIVAPKKKSTWTDKLLVEDDKGVLISIREQIRQWEETEEYVRSRGYRDRVPSAGRMVW